MKIVFKGFVTREDLLNLCKDMRLTNISNREWDILYDKFDIEGNSRVSVIDVHTSSYSFAISKLK